MKRVLIICPYFAPSNAADMHRVRTGLPYFKEFGWEAEIVTVDPKHSEMVKDPLFLQGIPKEIKIHSIDAIPKKWTSKIGLGSLAIRSLWYYKKFVDSYLKTTNFDLIYFSTTEFPVCILGPYWNKKFGVPYVIDMQDPWHSTYYLGKEKSAQPPKYWFTYRLHKYLEPIAMNKVNGVISVSESYINVLKDRYERMKSIPTSTITFGAFKQDIEIAKSQGALLKPMFEKQNGRINIVYVGRGGNDMKKAITLLFNAFKNGLKSDPENFKKLKFNFIGTSYAPSGQGKYTILPIAQACGIQDYVMEQTDRISYYQNIITLLEADALIIPGSDDPNYTASKIFPYILAQKPMLAIFNPKSSAYKIIKESNAGQVVSLKDENNDIVIQTFLSKLVNGSELLPSTDWQIFENYSARKMTEKQCNLFDDVMINHQQLPAKQ